MPFRPSREPRTGEDPFLLPKMLLFVAGAMLGIIGMATERSGILWLAFAVLALGIVLRWAGSGRTDHGNSSE